LGGREIFHLFLCSIDNKKIFYIFYKNKKLMENSLSVVVCSRDNNEIKDRVIEHIKETCGTNVHTYYMYNPEGVGLSEIYNTMLKEEKTENDIIVFIHDDIEFLRKGWGGEILRLFNENEDYGIIGVAGSAQFDSNATWWQYEKKYGQIPDGAFVALRTDWYKNWPDMEKLSGAAPDGSEHFPGWSLDALKYIFETRNAAANGHETLDTDASKEAAKAGDLACERYVLAQNKLQVEVLCNLDKVAPAGAILIVSYPRIEGATGLPARVWALTE
jgi:hypothetical protein